MTRLISLNEQIYKAEEIFPFQKSNFSKSFDMGNQSQLDLGF